MPEQEMYDLICKDRFDKIDEKLDQIDRKLSGNGLLTRTAIIEKDIGRLKSYWKWTVGIITALIVKIVYGLFK